MSVRNGEEGSKLPAIDPDTTGRGQGRETTTSQVHELLQGVLTILKQGFFSQIWEEALAFHFRKFKHVLLPNWEKEDILLLKIH